MAALVATSMGVVREVLGDSVVDEVDQPIVDYIANVLADQDFDFGPPDGHGIFDALGELLIDARCVYDQEHCLEVCAKLCEKLGSHGIVKPKPAVRSLAAPLRMNAGMEEEKAPKQKEYIFDAPPLSARDKAKIERNKRKEDRQREAQYEMHVAEMEALRAGMPPVYVNHSNVGGSTIRDIHMENFSVTVGGRDLIQDQTLTLAFGRHYGLIGRNGTGKTSLLRAMAQHAIDGIPKNCQILHVEQEVTGDDTTALQCVLNADVERVQLMQEEARLGQQLKDLEYEAESSQSLDKNKDSLEKDAIGKRLEEIYKRLEYIDADAAEARAASILAGLSFTPEMQLKNTKAFSGGWRMRIALARALFIEPDLLLLDEPTNHLDIHAVLWLETYLLKWPKTFIVVSHAREFLNTVVTDILHLHGKKLHAYKGDYDTFERTREEHLKNQMKAFETNEKARGHMQAGQLHLVKPYMAAVESNNVSAVNETLNELYVEEEDYERLHESADMHDNFNLITLARKVNLFNFMDIKKLRSILKKFGKDAGTTKEELARRAEKENDSMLNQLPRAALWNLCKGNNVCYKVTETREALASKLINHKKKMMIKLEAERELQGKVSNELEADASSTHAEVSFSRDRTNDLSFECEPVPLDGLDDAEAGASGGHAYYISPMLQSQADRKTAILEQILGQLAENQRQYVSDRQQILEQLSELHCQRENDHQQIQRQLAELQQQNEQIQGQLAELQQQSESDRQENRDLRNLALVSLAATARHSSQFSAAMALLDESLTAICRL